MKPWDCVEEMVSDETTKATLIEWAVKFAEGKTDYKSAMHACEHVCDVWRIAIFQPVLDRLRSRVS